MDEIIKVHIWELPEKTSNIDKSNEYTIVHDGYTKKVKLEKLYEYFIQDDKMNNLVKYFEDYMYSLNKEYEPKYSVLEISLKDYETLVKELQDKFKVNRNNIRTLETMSIQLDNSIEDITQIFEDIDNRSVLLLSTLENFSIKIYNMTIKSRNNGRDIEKLDENISTLINDTSQLYINNGSMKDQLANIKSNTDKNIDSKKDIILKNISSEYDKILAIIDYYNHVHDKI